MKFGTIAGIALAIMLILPLSMNATAQTEITGKVYGYVYAESGDVVIQIWPAPEGGPIEGASVSIRPLLGEISLPSSETTTDSSGYFEFNDILAGEYEIIVSFEGYEDHYEKFSLAGGDNCSFKIVLGQKYEAPEPVAPDAKIFGYAKNAQTGEVLKGVFVSVSGSTYSVSAYATDSDYGEPKASEPYYGGYYSTYNSTYTDGNGYYEMNCWSGENWIYAYAEGDGYKQYNAQITLNAGDNEYDIELEPKPPKTVKVSGYVKDAETGEPIWVRRASDWVYADDVSSDAAVSSDGEESSGSGSSGSTGAEPAPAYDGGEGSSEYIGAYVYLSNQENPDWNSTTTDENGYFEMWTYPGYSSISIWADGYYSFDISVDLAGAYENTFGIKPRPAPDCILSGTVINKTSGQPVAGAYVNAWNDETYAYGYAQTDENGNYELKLLHGWNHVSIWADGYYSYSATVDLAAGKKADHDVSMKPGNYRYYPIMYAEDADSVKSSAPVAADEAGASNMQNSMARQSQYSSSNGGYALSQDVEVEITDGGTITGIPGFEVLALIGAIGAAVITMRRRK